MAWIYLVAAGTHVLSGAVILGILLFDPINGRIPERHVIFVRIT